MDTVKPEDLVLILFGYSRHDVNLLTGNASDSPMIAFYRNISCASVSTDFLLLPVYSAYLYSGSVYVLQLPPETKYACTVEEDKYRNASRVACHVVYLSLEDFGPQPFTQLWLTMFADLGTTVANQVAQAFRPREGSLKDLTGNAMWLWSSDNFADAEIGIIRMIWTKLWIMVKSVVAFAVLSTVTAFMFRIGLMTSSVFLVFCSKS